MVFRKQAKHSSAVFKIRSQLTINGYSEIVYNWTQKLKHRDDHRSGSLDS